MLNPWGDQKILVSVLRDFYFLRCAWDSCSISWKRKKRALGFTTPTSLLFSQYTPDLS